MSSEADTSEQAAVDSGVTDGDAVDGGDDDLLAAAVRSPDGDWLAATPTGQLPDLANWLLRHSEQLAAGDRGEEALPAAVAATRAYRVLFDAEPADLADLPARLGVDNGYVQALSWQVQLLVAAGRLEDVRPVNDQLMAARDRIGQRAGRLLGAAAVPAAAAPAPAPPPPLPSPPPEDILHQLAGQLREAGDRSAARPVLERELALRERSHGPDSPEVASLLWELATSYYRPHRHYRLARRALERTRQILDARHGPRSVEVSHVLGDLAAVLRDQDDLPAAKSTIERRLAILEEVRGPDNRGTAGCLEQLATVSAQLGDLKGAAAALTRAVAIYERGSPGPDADRARRALVSSLLQTGDPDAIRAVYEELLADRRETVGPDAEEVVTLLAELVPVALAFGEPETARSARRRIVDARELAHGPDAPAVAAATGDLATLLWRLGDREAALAAAERAVAIDERAGAAAQVALARDLVRVGGMLRELADLPAARTTYERALRGYERALGPNHWEVAHTLRRLGELLAELGEATAATAATERAELIERWGDS